MERICTSSLDHFFCYCVHSTGGERRIVWFPCKFLTDLIFLRRCIVSFQVNHLQPLYLLDFVGLVCMSLFFSSFLYPWVKRKKETPKVAQPFTHTHSETQRKRIMVMYFGQNICNHSDQYCSKVLFHKKRRRKHTSLWNPRWA